MISISMSDAVKFLLIILVFGCVSMPADQEANADKSGDLFVGTYTQAPFVGTYGNVNSSQYGQVVQVKKSGDLYQLTGAYADYAFIKKSKGVLEDISKNAPIVRRGALGSITAGKMVFADGSPPVQILKAEFCYEHFLLIKHPNNQPVAWQAEKPLPTGKD